MRRERLTLHLRYEHGREIWSLSDGTAVEATAATTTIRRADIRAAGDLLFPDTRPQTWTYKPEDIS